MSRFKKKILIFAISITTSCLGSLTSSVCFGDVALVNSDALSELAQGDEGFPESSFGAPPMKPKLRGIFDENEDLKLKTVTLQKGSKPGRTLASVSNENKPNHPVPVKSPPSSQLALSSSLTDFVNKKGAVQEVSLIVDELGFYPRVIFATQNIPIKLYVTTVAKRNLCLILDEFHVKKQVRLQKVEEITILPREAGEFRMNCPVNGIEGKILVRELSQNPNQESR